MSRWWHGRTSTRALLWAGIAAVALYGVGDLVSGLLYGGYSFRDQAISELAAFGSPVRPLMVTVILLHDLLLVAFGVGVWRSAARKSLRWAGLSLVAIGVSGTPTHTVFAMSSRWMEAGFNDTMHQAFTAVFTLLVVVAIVLSAIACPGWFRRFSIGVLVVLTGFGAAAAFAIQGIEENATAWAGAFERINAYAYFAWLVALAAVLLRANVTATESLLTMLPKLFGSILRLRGTSTPPVGTPNGIAELKQVELNGYPQWVLIRGHDVSDPLFLFLHGGPGESSLWLAHHTMKELERHFVCVNWDQRGAGKSLLPGPEPASMTIDQLYADTVALIGQLLARFEKEKLLLLGHSWGGLLATRVAARHPELLHGVILMNPTIDSRRGEELSYDWALERSRDAHDDKAVRTLERLGGSDTYGQDGRFIERQVVFRHGGLVHSDPKRMVRIMLEAPEYSIADCIRAFRMKSLSFSIPLMADELMKINLIEEVPRLAVPVFFFLGRHDHTAPTELSREFHSSLRAPYKEVVWFEESAHTPDLDEPEKFQREIIRIGQELCRSEPLALAAGWAPLTAAGSCS